MCRYFYLLFFSTFVLMLSSFLSSHFIPCVNLPLSWQNLYKRLIYGLILLAKASETEASLSQLSEEISNLSLIYLLILFFDNVFTFFWRDLWIRVFVHFKRNSINITDRQNTMRSSFRRSIIMKIFDVFTFMRRYLSFEYYSFYTGSLSDPFLMLLLTLSQIYCIFVTIDLFQKLAHFWKHYA